MEITILLAMVSFPWKGDLKRIHFLIALTYLPVIYFPNFTLIPVKMTLTANSFICISGRRCAHWHFITYSAHSQAHFWNNYFAKVKQKLSFYIFQTQLERNWVWKGPLKVPSPKQGNFQITPACPEPCLSKPWSLPNKELGNSFLLFTPSSSEQFSHLYRHKLFTATSAAACAQVWGCGTAWPQVFYSHSSGRGRLHLMGWMNQESLIKMIAWQKVLGI